MRRDLILHLFLRALNILFGKSFPNLLKVVNAQYRIYCKTHITYHHALSYILKLRPCTTTYYSKLAIRTIRNYIYYRISCKLLHYLQISGTVKTISAFKQLLFFTKHSRQVNSRVISKPVLQIISFLNRQSVFRNV